MMGVATTVIALDRLIPLVDRALHAIGVPAGDIPIVRDVLMYAELRGNNQGLAKIPIRTVVPRADRQPIRIERRLPCVAHIDAHGQGGMPTLVRAADEAVDLARVHGIGLVAVRDRVGSTGAVGYYVERIASRGLVGLLLGGSPKAVAPAGTVDPLLGTNPLAIGIPSADGPLVLDMATSAMAWYGLILAQSRGEPIPSGLAFDAQGHLTTDPTAALQGAILAFAGHKGSGLALMIELLTGPLIGNWVVSDGDRPQAFGEMVIAIDPAAFGDAATFPARVSAFLARVREARRVPGGEAIQLPGERGNRQAARARAAGEIPIDSALLDQIVALADADAGGPAAGAATGHRRL